METLDLTALRREFHQNPELGWCEIATSAKVAQLLKQLEYTVLTGRQVCRAESRMGLPEQAVLDAAYDSLSNAKDLSAVNAELKEAAADLNVAVSDLFDISATEEVSFPLTLTLKNKNLDNFVAMLQYVDGAWQWVDAEVNGDEITFTVDSLGVFAVVVSVEEAASPDTGDSVPYGMIIGAVVLVGAAAWFFAKSRKVKA